MGVNVVLIVEADDGKISYIEAEGATYEAVKVQAEAKIPEGCKAIAVHTA